MGQQASPEGMQADKQKQDNWFKFSCNFISNQVEERDIYTCC